MRAVHIYDFDGTLFRTPQRPNWYDNNLDGVWHQNPLSFAEPCLPKGERWVKSIVSEAKRSIASKDVYTIVLTGRKTPFQRVVEDLLSSKGLKFDEVILKDSGDTESFKNRVIDRLMAQFPDAEIHIWEDRHNHLKVFMDHIEMRGGVGIPHAVPQNYSVAECSEEEFRNMRRSASETIRNLEHRIARLEKQSAPYIPLRQEPSEDDLVLAVINDLKRGQSMHWRDVQRVIGVSKISDLGVYYALERLTKNGLIAQESNNVFSKVARLKRQSSDLFKGLLDDHDPVKDAENLDAFKVRLKGLISILRTEKPHSLAKELQNILDTYAKTNSPKKVEVIRISVLHNLNLGQRQGLRATPSSKVAPSNFKEQNIDKTEDLLVNLLNYRLLK